jgi:hypothetical protein
MLMRQPMMVYIAITTDHERFFDIKIDSGAAVDLVNKTHRATSDSLIGLRWLEKLLKSHQG